MEATLDPLDPLGIRKRYPAAVFIPIEQIDEALSRARRATTLHNKRIGLSVGLSRLARLEHNAQGLSVPELPDLRRRVSVLQCEVDDLTRAQAAQIAEKARLESLPLAQQCQELGIRLERLAVSRTKTGWNVAGRLYRHPEPAAFAHLAGLGYVGGWNEGASLQILMHAACLDYALAHYPPGKRYGDDILLRTVFHAIADQMHDHAQQLLECIRNAERATVHDRLGQLLALALPDVISPLTSSSSLMALWDALGGPTMASLATLIVQGPWSFRMGWPDLTVVKNGTVRFIEVKTTDTLLESQIDTIREVLLPASMDVSVLQLMPT